MLPTIRESLAAGEVEGLWHPTVTLRPLHGPGSAHVHARHAGSPNAQLLESLRAHLPARGVCVEIQHIDSHLLIEPLPRPKDLVSGPITRLTEFRRVTHLRRLQRMEGRIGDRRRFASFCGKVLNVRPGAMGLQVSMALHLHANPAPIPLPSIIFPAHLLFTDTPPGRLESPAAQAVYLWHRHGGITEPALDQSHGKLAGEPGVPIQASASADSWNGKEILPPLPDSIVAHSGDGDRHKDKT
mmetsp:Transcript_100617/g.215651  ORF Transcript_100617/g.215651 Transcript_100617/m.215651 type:complete len:242 (+) Transcript_100617:238-963(+)